MTDLSTYKRILILLLHKNFLIILILLFATGCINSPKEKKEWTYLVYMAADNGLNINALADINEMEKSVFDKTKINVVVEIDWDNTYHEQGIERFLIQTDSNPEINSTLIQTLPEHNSGSPENLSNFINWGMKYFPAKHYGVIIWSHGNGWYRKSNKFQGNGLCPDITDEGEISVHKGEFRNALSNANNNIDILIMDACHMQSIEVAYEIYSFCDYYIASENEIPSKGLPYHQTFNAISQIADTEKIVEKICFLYDDFYYNQIGTPRSTTISALKTNEFEKILKKWNTFWENNPNLIEPKILEKLYSELHYYQNPPRDVDIIQLLEKIKQLKNDKNISKQITDLISSFNETYLYVYQINLYGLGTTSVWFPKSRQNFNILKDEYSTLKFAKNKWFSILKEIYK